ncbi:MAG: ImmA/IrrE family metallo-endopeptidase [Chitinispirillaceae bacterium]|nr:ImmA/IrrE family metallo-endopeptidase [Chitinispirillaceae bacterium]
MKNKISVYNKLILKILAEKYPQKWQKIDIKNKDKWILGEDYPTYKQLVEISKIFNIPFGYLFLQKLPEKTLPIPYYRTNTNENNIGYVSDELLDTVNFVKKQQEWVKDILVEWGYNPLPFAGKHSLQTNIKEITQQIKNLLQLKNNWASTIQSWNDAFKYLIEKLEDAGIFVVVNGIVGNNIHRKLDVNEFRGFVLYDEIAPFVFINNNDFVSAKIFTIIHELVHILLGKSASFDLRNLQCANNEIEVFCDKCTAEFLVPTNEIINIKEIDYENLAKRFKVSQIVIARRMIDVGKITKEEFNEFYQKYKKEEIKITKSKGGDFYNTAIYRYGKRFLSIIGYALKNNEILYRDLYRLLSLKPSTSEKILTDVI